MADAAASIPDGGPGGLWPDPVVEQAKELLAGWLACTPEVALEVLRGASQEGNVKLRALAAKLVEQAAADAGGGLAAWLAGPGKR